MDSCSSNQRRHQPDQDGLSLLQKVIICNWSTKTSVNVLLYYEFRVFFLLTTTLLVKGQQMDQFAMRLMENMACTKPVFIFNPDETQLSKWAHFESSALISAIEYEIMIDQLSILIETDDIDIIFFLISGQARLIRNVVNKLEILKSKVKVIIPFGDSSNFQSRLNSHLFLYKTNGDEVILFESYQIR